MQRISTQEAAQVTQLLAKQLLRELGLSEDLEVIQKTGNSPLVSEDAVLDIAQTLQALEIIAGSKAQSVYQTLLELRLSDVLNMLLHHLIHSRTPFLTQNLSRILRPLTNLYAALFEIPALGRLGHFEFLHETLSGLDYSDSYSLQIGHGISKILIALGRSPAFGQDLISAFHEAHLMRTLVSSVQNSIDLNNVQKAPLLLTLILQLLKVRYLRYFLCEEQRV